MYTESKWIQRAFALAAMTMITTASAHAAPVPDYMKIVDVNDGTPTPKGKIAFNNIYALNDGMFPIYESSLVTFRKNFLARHPLIMGLFSAKGGRFILYRPGHEPLEAESPPPIYRLTKSVGHCAMATFDLVAPYCGDSAADLSWRGEMEAYRTRLVTAVGSLNEVEISSEHRELLRDSMKQILAFMDGCLSDNVFTYADVEAFARGMKPNLAKLITVASSTQVAHWYKVLEQWKEMLGKDWDDTYALSNSIYVARQNNILFTVLAQFMGEKTMNDRLLLLETTDFTASPDDMMNGFIRIISDRAIGMAFFGNYRLMDYELLGGGGRAAIIAEAEKRGKKPVLPPLVPYNSTGWPWKVDPGTGSGPTLMEEIH